MSAGAALILGWARSAVAPLDAGLRSLLPHTLGAPVALQALARAGVAPQAVDAVVLGNALGAGGNPARMLALQAGLPDACAAFSVDTQCCSGLDAVALACGLLASGQASVVLAGGVEAWSRAPLRMHRPLVAGAAPVAYARPAFAPDARRDPDLLQAAARYARQQAFSRAMQDEYAQRSHQRAVANQHWLAQEIVPLAGLAFDTYPRLLDARRAARMPAVAVSDRDEGAADAAVAPDCRVSALGISARADGAGFVVLATAQACARLQLRAPLRWRAYAALGCAPEMPLLAAQFAAAEAMRRAGLAGSGALDLVELHDAFAVQGLGFCQALALDPARINLRGGGLARGHPIGASAAIALVRLLSDLVADPLASLGLTAVAGAGGVGAAAVVEKIR